MIEIAILIALSAIFLVDYCVPYEKVLTFLKLWKKPLNCSLCMSFWIAVIVSLCIWTPMMILFPLATAMIQIILQRLINLLPITFN